MRRGYNGPVDALVPNAGTRARSADEFERDFATQATALWAALPAVPKGTVVAVGEALGRAIDPDTVRVRMGRAAFIASQHTGGTRETRAVRARVREALGQRGYVQLDSTAREDVFQTGAQASVVQVLVRGAGRRQDVLVTVIVPYQEVARA